MHSIFIPWMSQREDGNGFVYVDGNIGLRVGRKTAFIDYRADNVSECSSRRYPHLLGPCSATDSLHSYHRPP